LFLFALRRDRAQVLARSVQFYTDGRIDAAKNPPVVFNRFRCVMQQSQQAPSMLPVGRPDCAKCNTRMALIRIEPDSPDTDRRTFECPSCEHYEVFIVPYLHGATPHG
jgi:hypothetical protein